MTGAYDAQITKALKEHLTRSLGMLEPDSPSAGDSTNRDKR